ncbi:MAG: hypothetical protein EOO41_05210, partial [Methanobacteriota archaeon]
MARAFRDGGSGSATNAPAVTAAAVDALALTSARVSTARSTAAPMLASFEAPLEAVHETSALALFDACMVSEEGSGGGGSGSGTCTAIEWHDSILPVITHSALQNGVAVRLSRLVRLSVAPRARLMHSSGLGAQEQALPPVENMEAAPLSIRTCAPTLLTGLEVSEEDYFAGDAILFSFHDSGQCWQSVVSALTQAGATQGTPAYAHALHSAQASFPADSMAAGSSFRGSILPSQVLVHSLTSEPRNDPLAAHFSSSDGADAKLFGLRMLFPSSASLFETLRPSARLLFPAAEVRADASDAAPDVANLRELYADVLAIVNSTIDSLSRRIARLHSLTAVTVGPGPIIVPPRPRVPTLL